MFVISAVILSNGLIAQDEEIIARLGSIQLLSKNKESCSYREILEKYRVVIFASIEDCSTCISGNAPWIQMLRSRHVSACFVILHKSFRVARYFHQTSPLPFDWYCDTTKNMMQVIGNRNTPIVLIVDSDGRQLFFDNPLYQMKRFSGLIEAVHLQGSRKRGQEFRH